MCLSQWDQAERAFAGEHCINCPLVFEFHHRTLPLFLFLCGPSSHDEETRLNVFLEIHLMDIYSILYSL